jgi:hypothetical protein
MGIMDHNKTWEFRVHAPPADCLSAFRRAFTGGGGLLAKAKWDISTTASGAKAMYRGRAGMVKAFTIFSDRAASEEDAAIGSMVTFEMAPQADGTVECKMWLSSAGSKMGFTADARFFKPYMRSVETELRSADPSVVVTRG